MAARLRRAVVGTCSDARRIATLTPRLERVHVTVGDISG
jgi:hypothetical protein